ncbi:hypothetical protein MRX96_014892 [Rhipicephalus microplus]
MPIEKTDRRRLGLRERVEGRRHHVAAPTPSLLVRPRAGHDTTAKNARPMVFFILLVLLLHSLSLISCLGGPVYLGCLRSRRAVACTVKHGGKLRDALPRRPAETSTYEGHPPLWGEVDEDNAGVLKPWTPRCGSAAILWHPGLRGKGEISTDDKTNGSSGGVNQIESRDGHGRLRSLGTARYLAVIGDPVRPSSIHHEPPPRPADRPTFDGSHDHRAFVPGPIYGVYTSVALKLRRIASHTGSQAHDVVCMRARGQESGPTRTRCVRRSLAAPSINYVSGGRGERAVEFARSRFALCRKASPTSTTEAVA